MARRLKGNLSTTGSKSALRTTQTLKG
jgi:hypothetical protein